MIFTLRPSILLLLFAANLAASSLASANSNPANAAQKPNIVFLLADDMNRDTWGTYGSIDCKTPNIDRLAQDGMRFDRAYSSVAMCAPFRQELYSGRTPWRTGTLPNHSISKRDTKSLPHYLKPLGYRVALLGKKHIAPKDCYPFEYLKDGDIRKDLNPLFMEEAFNFIDSCVEEKKPFCLFIASHDSHDPFTTGDRSAYNAADLTIPPYWLDTPKLREELVKYYAEITNFDALVGSVREGLEKRDLWKDTLFIVCSEQGTQLPFAKWTCYDNGLHTGMIAHWDRVTKPGSVIDELISIADVTPTLVELAGGILQKGDCDGNSFAALLRGEERQAVRKYVYGAFTNCNISHNQDRIYPIRVIRDEHFTLIYNPNFKEITSNLTLSGALEVLDGKKSKCNDVAGSWVELSRTDRNASARVYKLHHRPEYELYDLRKDPYELHNEIDNPEYKDVADRLKKQLLNRLAELGDSDPIETEKSLVKTKK